MTAAAPSKLYSDDVSLVVVLLDTNPFFWSSATASSLPFSKFLNQVIPFLNSLLLLNQFNQVVLIATGTATCGYIYDSSAASPGDVPAVCTQILRKLEEFLIRDREKRTAGDKPAAATVSSLLSGSLSLALCWVLVRGNESWIPLKGSCVCALGVASFFSPSYGPLFKHQLTLNACLVDKEEVDIQRVFRSGAIHPQPRILCLQGSPDGPEQYVAVMNAIFSAQRSMVPIDSCVVGAHHSAFLQQASYITSGVYLKPQYLDGLFEYLTAVFATDLQSRNFLQLPKPMGVDFRASCFCHKKTIDMGFVCSVCLSIFCKQHKKCSTCGSEFNRAPPDPNATSDRKGKGSDY